MSLRDRHQPARLALPGFGRGFPGPPTRASAATTPDRSPPTDLATAAAVEGDPSVITSAASAQMTDTIFSAVAAVRRLRLISVSVQAAVVTDPFWTEGDQKPENVGPQARGYGGLCARTTWRGYPPGASARRAERQRDGPRSSA